MVNLIDNNDSLLIGLNKLEFLILLAILIIRVDITYKERGGEIEEG